MISFQSIPPFIFLLQSLQILIFLQIEIVMKKIQVDLCNLLFQKETNFKPYSQFFCWFNKTILNVKSEKIKSVKKIYICPIFMFVDNCSFISYTNIIIFDKCRVKTSFNNVRMSKRKIIFYMTLLSNK